MYRYKDLTLESQAVSRRELLIDSECFGFGLETAEDAHLELLQNNDVNFFDERGVLLSNGGMYV